MKKEIQLSPDQLKAIQLPPTGCYLIRGGAGSGKTLIAIKRAEYLYELQREKSDENLPICIFTYNCALRRSIEKQITNKSINVMGIDQWAREFLEIRSLYPLKHLDIEKYFSKAKEEVLGDYSYKFGNLPPSTIYTQKNSFYLDKIAWIKNLGVSSFDEYVDANENWGTIKNPKSVQFIWDLYQAYESILSKQNVLDYNDRVKKTIEMIDNDPNWRPVFSHIIIDEAQDFTCDHMSLIQRLISKDTNSITILLDPSQEIYDHALTWTAIYDFNCEEEIVLLNNYRNTKQIADVANSLLPLLNDPEQYPLMNSSDREGEKPTVILGDIDCQVAYFLKKVSEIPKNESIVIGVMTKQELSQIVNSLMKRRYPLLNVRTLTREKYRRSRDSGKHLICYSTIHGLKGLEFSHVFLFGLCADEYFPWSRPSVQYEQAIKLIYMGASRAKKTLTIFVGNGPAMFITQESRELYTVFALRKEKKGAKDEEKEKDEENAKNEE